MYAKCTSNVIKGATELLYTQMPNKRGGLNKLGGRKKSRALIDGEGVQNKRGGKKLRNGLK